MNSIILLLPLFTGLILFSGIMFPQFRSPLTIILVPLILLQLFIYISRTMRISKEKIKVTPLDSFPEQDGLRIEGPLHKRSAGNLNSSSPEYLQMGKFDFGVTTPLLISVYDNLIDGETWLIEFSKSSKKVWKIEKVI